MSKKRKVITIVDSYFYPNKVYLEAYKRHGFTHMRFNSSFELPLEISEKHIIYRNKRLSKIAEILKNCGKEREKLEEFDKWYKRIGVTKVVKNKILWD